jgi:hypothetical protein
MSIQATKFVKNIFKVKPRPNHNHHKNIPISTPRIVNVIENQIDNIAIFTDLDNTHTNSSLPVFSQA